MDVVVHKALLTDSVVSLGSTLRYGIALSVYQHLRNQLFLSFLCSSAMFCRTRRVLPLPSWKHLCGWSFVNPEPLSCLLRPSIRRPPVLLNSRNLVSGSTKAFLSLQIFTSVTSFLSRDIFTQTTPPFFLLLKFNSPF